MNETTQIIVSIVFLIGVFFLTQFFMARKYRAAAEKIVNGMKEKGAVSPETAIEIDFGKKNLLQMGVRDYRPKALKALVSAGVIKVTDEGLCYVPENPGQEEEPDQDQDLEIEENFKSA
ncbi:hypothetical protein [Dethiosulfatarculus sandiegensis]|uniref:Uncharacterized protein n=1 Tax=Dethiosulfatarculus sandiegensis TaxID=1429043 RepID=A0A0D2K3D6_9BACT|nr:hypothetical protein [Dethiosulfatarculus sandiegensis]KIX16065.1 hypothetical protein X474_00840 [Dethiosulfatarculus sandiegensis]